MYLWAPPIVSTRALEPRNLTLKIEPENHLEVTMSLPAMGANLINHVTESSK